MSPAERERKVRVDQFRGGASGAPRSERPGTAHETEKTVREMRIEIAAAITSGEARNGTRDREDGSRDAHRDCGSNHERGGQEWHTRPRRRFARCASRLRQQSRAGRLGEPRMTEKTVHEMV